MYKKPFYIKNPVWNNSFSFEKRKNKQIYVPSLIEWNLDDAKLWDEIVFAEVDEKWNKLQFKWLKNFIKTTWNNIPLILADNHNHVFYFWAEAKIKWIIWYKNTLVHIDEHKDMRDPEIYLSKNEVEDLQKVFDYTNYTLNVGNYIIPALKINLIKEVINISWENELEKNKDSKINWNYILNLDLDFFSDWLSYIDYNLKKSIILNFAKNAKLITVATSPFFIEQEKALKILKDIFGN